MRQQLLRVCATANIFVENMRPCFWLRLQIWIVSQWFSSIRVWLEIGGSKVSNYTALTTDSFLSGLESSQIPWPRCGLSMFQYDIDLPRYVQRAYIVLICPALFLGWAVPISLAALLAFPVTCFFCHFPCLSLLLETWYYCFVFCLF